MKTNISIPVSRSDSIGWMGLVLALLLAVPGVRAASVGPGGYANDFSLQPAAADFATTVLIGGSIFALLELLMPPAWMQPWRP